MTDKSISQNVVGQTFYFLTVLEEYSRNWRRRWKCRCVCGNITDAVATDIKTGNTTSCGCRKGDFRHGYGRRSNKRAPEYVAWASMKNRCKSGRGDNLKYYGSRGIVVCERWHEFTNFLADMGERPTANHSLDRINNDGNYEPSNCRWATIEEQNRNHRRNRFYTFQGETLCVTDWAKRVGVTFRTMVVRLQRWPLEQALTTPPNPPHHLVRRNNVKDVNLKNSGT